MPSFYSFSLPISGIFWWMLWLWLFQGRAKSTRLVLVVWQLFLITTTINIYLSFNDKTSQYPRNSWNEYVVEVTKMHTNLDMSACRTPYMYRLVQLYWLQKCSMFALVTWPSIKWSLDLAQTDKQTFPTHEHAH